uniref:Endoplasmic reticulum junction formation protein lunapark n=1 Tax=Latimeria chalumnae TaxID=7897 RepID=H3ASP6_LATCH
QAKPSTVEILESIEKEIHTLEEFREKNQRRQKLWIGRLLLGSSVLYVLTCIVVYFWYLPNDLVAKLIMALLFFAIPGLVWSSSSLQLIFQPGETSANQNEVLEDLKAQKKSILEEVMEKETYKTAKLILERFDPDSKKAKDFEQMPASGMPMTPKPGQELRHRNLAQRSQASSTPVTQSQGVPRGSTSSPGLQQSISAPGGPPEKTVLSTTVQPNVLSRHPMSPSTLMPGIGLHPPGPPLARPILPRERGAVDRIIEYLVGDGPQNRYALVCQQCFSHNGMALKEEFEYIAFRCAYCFFLNPARKTRPQAPRLPEFSFEKRQHSESQSSAGSSQSVGATVQETPPPNEPVEEIDIPIRETEEITEKLSSAIEKPADLTEGDEKEDLAAKAETPLMNITEQIEGSPMETE